MGMHEICRNPYHSFDRSKELIAEKIGDDILYWGYCKECCKLRIIYESELKKENIVKYKK